MGGRRHLPCSRLGPVGPFGEPGARAARLKRYEGAATCGARALKGRRPIAAAALRRTPASRAGAANDPMYEAAATSPAPQRAERARGRPAQRAAWEQSHGVRALRPLGALWNYTAREAFRVILFGAGRLKENSGLHLYSGAAHTAQSGHTIDGASLFFVSPAGAPPLQTDTT